MSLLFPKIKLDSLPGFPHANAVLPQYGDAFNFRVRNGNG
mgnify:CR=1 FL=1